MEVKRIIIKFLIGSITKEEKQHLDEWMNKSSKRKDLIEKLRASTDLQQRYEAYSQINSEKAWQSFKKQQVRRPKRMTLELLKYAAVVAIVGLFVVAGWLLYTPTSYLADSHYNVDSIQPGVSDAVLTVSDKDSKMLGQAKGASVKVAQSVKAKMKNGTLVYPYVSPESKKSGRLHTDVIENNTLTTKEGNEFKVTLEDGTTISMNYSTEIRYPVNFSSSERVVELVRGEAYFHVAKDERPFIVLTTEGRVKQYGTEFNINTFVPGQTEVTLVEGSISVTTSNSDQEHFIKPQQQAIINAGDDLIKVVDINVDPYVAWKDGRFVFDDTSLEKIAEILEHWYKVNITFGKSELKELHFTGNLDRYGSIATILQAIERTTDLRIEVIGREVLISDY